MLALRALDAVPHLRAALDQLLRELDIPSQVEMVVKGSIAAGHVDAFSDIDLRFVGDPVGVARVQQAFSSTVARLGPVITSFPATHLGLPDLLINFIEVDGMVVKIDADFSPEDETGSAESTLTVLRDIDRKFTGWLWYVFSKIARGELFEAVDALDTMRARAVVPSLQLRAGIPAEGFRRLEDRLDAAQLKRLRDTYPRSFERSEMLRALHAMVSLYQELRDAIAERGEADHRDGDLARMFAIIERQETKLGISPANKGEA